VPDLQVRREGGTLHLVLDRPERRNALSPQMRQGLIDQMAVAAADLSVRAVVLRGAGGTFCSGGDVTTQGGGRTALDSIDRLLFGRRVVEAVVNLAKPVVAVVEGHAVGAGLGLALSCDLVVARDDARFSAIFARRGLVPDMGTTYFLARQVGLHRAKELVMTARMFGAEEAYRLGLLARCWPAETFEEEVADFVAWVTAGPTAAWGTAKRALNRTFESDLSTMLEMETLGQAVATQTRDHQDAVTAFRDKTDPSFTGS
jgi:2-(1,2-epoxy-1,2-dihydrophenyl)acetyl-CoA isomerase